MSKKPKGRRPWKAPDGVATQPSSQTFAANAGPRASGKRNVYEEMHMQAKRQYGKVKPGYGKTGRFPG